MGVPAVALVIVALLLTSCAATDFQLEPRNAAIDQQTDDARNNEILLNIVRASHSQPLNFVPISKTSGTQFTDLKIGLPTFTIGPAQTATQHQFVFGNNSWDNTANGSFDSAPLATHDFYTAMLSQVQLQIIYALLHEGFSRELVMDATIGAIRIERQGDGVIEELKNDPIGEPDERTCPSPSYSYGPNGSLNESPYSPAAAQPPPQSCEFHRFEFYLEAAMDWGLNVEIKEVPNPAYSEAAVKQAKATGKEAPPKTITKPRFCFDPAFARQQNKGYVMTFPRRCGVEIMETNSEAEQKDLIVRFRGRGGLSAPMKFTIIPRSPFAMFTYFGHILRTQGIVPVRLYWPSRSLGPADQILTITDSQIGGCFAKTFYFGSFYCVPYEGSDATKQVFAMLAQVVALSTTVGSLPTTVEVRLQ